MERLLHEIVRIIAVIVTAPLWYPVVKELWKEANAALRREGGILGRVPDAKALREIDRQERYEDAPLSSVPRARGEARPRAARPGAAPAPRRGAPQRRAGFR